MSTETDPIELALLTLAQRGIDAIVVGMTGVNFYAKDPSEAFNTLDIDFLVRPDVAPLKKVLRELKAAGFTFETGGEPFVDGNDDLVLRNVIANAATLRCVFEGEVTADLMLAMAGFSYDQIAADAVAFSVKGVEIRVGRLDKLIESKRLAGRAKDVAFLERYDALATEKKK